jgi:hypothetical protein
MLVDLLWNRTWWQYRPSDPSAFSLPYHAFNLFEGAAWLTFAGLVLWRHAKHRRSPVEVAYATAFLTFGLTDFREAYALSSWLVWIKLANLFLLARLRSMVIRRYYPESTLY